MRKGFAAIFITLILLTGLTACSQQNNELPGVDLTQEVLSVKGLDQEITYTFEEFLDLEISEGVGGTKSSTGKITLPQTFKGVSILELVSQLGEFNETMAVMVEAKDGYSITFSYDQLVNGDFINYDPGTGDEKTYNGDLEVIVAYLRDGEAIPEEGDGPLRLMIIGEDGNPITDGHWAVKWVVGITVKPLIEEWVLSLNGAISEEMDRVTFETGAAPGCHETIFVDEDGNEWTGIPLYYLVGRVDDEVKHETGAYNDDFAKEHQYVVEVVAKDGFAVEFDSLDVMRNDNIIVAYLLNGEALPEESFPLAIIGPDLTGKQKVKQIDAINLLFTE